MRNTAPSNLFMSEAAYRKAPGINYSTLKHLRKSPLHYKHAVENPEDSGQDYAMLRHVHALVLEPMSAHEQSVVWDGRRDQRNKEYAAFLETHKGKNILTVSEAAQAESIAAAYNGNGLVRWLLAISGTTCEVPLFCRQLVGDGVLALKGRPDIIHYSADHGLIVADLKTFGDTSAPLIAYAARKHGWLLQLAHYTLLAADLHEVDMLAVPLRWFTIVAEDKAPWDATAIEWDGATKAGALAEHQRLLEVLVDCQATGRWPGRGELQVATAVAGGVNDDQP
jgi:hypothetical protein